LTFTPGQTPPVTGFWSVTMYNQERFFEPNEIRRYSTGTKNQAHKYNPDGSLTIYMQNPKPAEDEVSNWLPAPSAEFGLFLRAYGPKEEWIKGDWSPPLVKMGRQPIT